jgi:DAK2 domain fusion protein YloV
MSQPVPTSSLARFRACLQGALAQLESRREEINDLNVFPVADGDTGDNMVLTLRACLTEVDRLAQVTDGRSLDDIGRPEIVDSVARAALLGARGNSGVILSQLIRGAAEELVSRPGELVDPVLVGAAMARGAQRAYASVRQPAEGTILTVMRDMATAVALELARGADAQLAPDADAAEQDRRIADVLERAIVAGEESVRRGPELLPALREAGVVDAGGYGVVVLFAGCVAALRGEEAPEVAHHHAPARVTHPEHESSTFRFCTNFAVTATGGGELADANSYVTLLEAIGDSVLVVGDHVTLRVHVHTDEPEVATGIFEGAGEVSRIDVADMRAQVADRDRRLAAAAPARPQQRCGALAIVSGVGLADMYRSLGCEVLDGGVTMNPSTYDILAGIHSVPAEEVVVLPNSRNVVMAAQAAADMSDKVVRVVPSGEQQAGLIAAVSLVADRDAAANADAMLEVLREVRTGQVAPAAREDAQGRFAVGDAVGYVGDDLVAWGEPEVTLAAVITGLAGDAELLTVISGHGAPLDGSAVEALVPDGVEVELADGGQPSRWWLLSAE